MKKWETEIYRENNIRLMRRHIVLSILYILLGVWLAPYAGNAPRLFVLIIFGIPVFLHALLAYGSYRGIEISRKASVVVFIFIAIASMPIGTLIAIFLLLPTTQWETPQES